MRGKSASSSTPSTNIDTPTASHQPSQSNHPKERKKLPTLTRRMSPSTRAPDATAGRCDETTSPPTVAPSSIVARPFNATTLSSTFPRTRTSPLNATTEPFTCPSITAGPCKITTLSVCSCAPTSTRPVMTTRAPSSLPLVCAAAGCASSPTRHASVASARPTVRSALCEDLTDPATAAPPRVARRHRRRTPVFHQRATVAFYRICRRSTLEPPMLSNESGLVPIAAATSQRSVAHNCHLSGGTFGWVQGIAGR